MDMSEIALKVTKLTDEAKTYGELRQLLHTIAFTIGGMVCHFEQDDRSSVVISLTEALGQGLMNTSVSIGEKCDIEMIVGKKS